jgi:hypothetical protein
LTPEKEAFDKTSSVRLPLSPCKKSLKEMISVKEGSSGNRGEFEN